MRLLLDNNLSPRLVDVLAKDGWDVGPRRLARASCGERPSRPPDRPRRRPDTRQRGHRLRDTAGRVPRTRSVCGARATGDRPPGRAARRPAACQPPAGRRGPPTRQHRRHRRRLVAYPAPAHRLTTRRCSRPRADRCGAREGSSGRCPRWGSNPHWDPFKGPASAGWATGAEEASVGTARSHTRLVHDTAVGTVSRPDPDARVRTSTTPSAAALHLSVAVAPAAHASAVAGVAPVGDPRPEGAGAAATEAASVTVACRAGLHARPPSGRVGGAVTGHTQCDMRYVRLDRGVRLSGHRLPEPPQGLQLPLPEQVLHFVVTQLPFFPRPLHTRHRPPPLQASHFFFAMADPSAERVRCRHTRAPKGSATPLRNVRGVVSL